MRSELVYRANHIVSNRFQLCHLTASSARSMTRSSVAMHESINQALEAISGHSAPIVAPEPQPAGEIKAVASDLSLTIDLPVFDPAV
jgi:hypothetical protein